MRGNRIQSIVNELQGEKIDVVRWDKDPKVFMANALSPSEVVHVEINDQEGSALVVVPERQLSLAIGKEGQNARLAAKLTNYRLDILSMAEWETLRAERQATAESRQAAAAGSVVEAPDAPIAEGELVQAEEALGIEEMTLEELEAATSPVASELEVVSAAPVEALPPDEPTEESVEIQDSGLSPEELALLALEELEEEVEPDEEDEDEEDAGQDIQAEVWNLPAVAAGAGQIRFAEDILGEFRGGGGGRRGRGSQGSSKGRKGARGKKARTGVEEG
jgi:N utilization substance protein A